jgi:hypothetical protein
VDGCAIQREGSLVCRLVSKSRRFKSVAIAVVVLGVLVVPATAQAHVIHVAQEVWEHDPYCIWVSKAELSHGNSSNDYGGYTRVDVLSLKSIVVAGFQWPCKPGVAGGVNKPAGQIETREALFIWVFPGEWALCHLGAWNFNSISSDAYSHHTYWRPPCGKGWYQAHLLGGAYAFNHWHTAWIIPCESAADGGRCFHWLPCASGTCD